MFSNELLHVAPQRDAAEQAAGERQDPDVGQAH
jgi:hypothetical protein